VKWILVALLTLHGLIHLMGPAKAFGWAELEDLSRPVSRGMGVLWLVAALAFLAAAGLVVAAPRVWWWVALGGVVLSQVAVVSAWEDAWLGTVANALVLAAVVHAAAVHGPWGLRAEYREAVADRVAAGMDAVADPGGAPGVLDEEALAPLPPPVARYLRLVGVVGRRRPTRLRATWEGRIRGGPDDPWMGFTAEQHNFLDEPARFFFMDAVRGGLPADVYHAYRGGQATMRVRLLSLVPMVDARGPEMDRAETVTVFNDLALLAPGGLSDPAIAWEAVDDTTARARYTVAGETVTATLHFAPSGELVDFVSDDRLAATDSGFVAMRWSTPVEGYRDFGELRAFSRGVGMWHPGGGVEPYAYFEAELTGLEVWPNG